MFNTYPVREWTGQLNLYFVDLEYKVKVQEAPVITDETKKIMAICSGVIGAACLAGGTQEKDQKRRHTFYSLGGISLAIALFSILSLEDKSQVQIEDPTKNKAARKLLESLPGNLNCKFNVSFISKAQDCIEAGITNDVISGYDIGSGKDDFDILREKTLKDDGTAALVIKQRHEKNKNLEQPIFLTGKGKSGYKGKEFPYVDVTKI